MPLRYHDPRTVISPKDYVKNVRVIFDGRTGTNPFSIAKIEWDGEDCFAIRWNVARREFDDPNKTSGKNICMGIPTSHGKPVWFVIPMIDLLNPNSEVHKQVQKFLNK